MTEPDQIVGLATQLLSAMNEATLEHSSTLASLEIARTLFLNQENAENAKAIRRKFFGEE